MRSSTNRKGEVFVASTEVNGCSVQGTSDADGINSVTSEIARC